MAPPPVSFLETDHHRLAYKKQEGQGPTVMFLPGFQSDMTGAKACALAAHCAAEGQAFLRFDYSGHGQSSGRIDDGTIGQWKADTLAVLDGLTEGEVVLVGSSMGAWLALLAALERPARMRALVGIAAAPDFTERLIWDRLDAAQKQALTEHGVFYAPSCHGEAPYPITLRLIEEARAHLVLDRPAPLPLTCPVHLLHGTQDEDVPLAIPHALQRHLQNATLTLLESGTHRLSREEDLRRICDTVRACSVAGKVGV